MKLRVPGSICLRRVRIEPLTLNIEYRMKESLRTRRRQMLPVFVRDQK